MKKLLKSFTTRLDTNRYSIVHCTEVIDTDHPATLIVVKRCLNYCGYLGLVRGRPSCVSAGNTEMKMARSGFQALKGVEPAMGTVFPLLRSKLLLDAGAIPTANLKTWQFAGRVHVFSANARVNNPVVKLVIMELKKLKVRTGH